MSYINGSRYYPNSGSVQTVNFTCDVYTNDSLHRVCVPAVNNTGQIIIGFEVDTLKS